MKFNCIMPLEDTLTSYILVSYSTNGVRAVKRSKAVPLHVMEAHGGERRYSSYLYLTSALDGGK
jgi:hypothetical protein